MHIVLFFFSRHQNFKPSIGIHPLRVHVLVTLWQGKIYCIASKVVTILCTITQDIVLKLANSLF